MTAETDSLVVTRTHVVDLHTWLARVDREEHQTIDFLERHHQHAEAVAAWRAHHRRTAADRRQYRRQLSHTTKGA